MLSLEKVMKTKRYRNETFFSNYVYKESTQFCRNAKLFKNLTELKNKIRFKK